MSGAETVAAVIATAAGIAAIVVDRLSQDSAAEALLVTGLAGAVTIGFAVLLFVGAVPRVKARSAAGRQTAGAAVTTSAVGFLSVASAWTGLPFVLGVGGAMMGRAIQRGASHPSQRLLAAFAVALGIAAVLLGGVALATV